MNLRATLNKLARVIADETERNPEFSQAIADVLEPGGKKLNVRADRQRSEDREASSEQPRQKNRRPRSMLDPVKLARESEESLRKALTPLSLDQLRDIVAEYGMDTGKLVMKWVLPERVIDRIVEISLSRAQKGNAFRKASDSGLQSDDDSITNAVPASKSEDDLASTNYRVAPDSTAANGGQEGLRPDEGSLKTDVSQSGN
jgi:hypothetical protein